MSQKKIKQLLLSEFFDRNGSFKYREIKKYQSLIPDIEGLTQKCSGDIKEKIYWIINDIEDYPICPSCGNTISKFRGFKLGYRKYCSYSCQNSQKRGGLSKDEALRKKYPHRYEDVDNIKEYLISYCLDKNKKISSKKLKTELLSIHLNKIDEYLKNETLFQVDDLLLVEKVKIIIENIKEYSKCNECGNIVKNIGKRYCSSSCSIHSSLTRKKIKETCIERYGVENVFQSEEIKDKIKSTFIERYNVEYPTQSDKIKDKIKSTCIERYNVENVFQSEEIKNTIKETNIQRYNVEYPTQSEEIKNKIKKYMY